jgi:hypothetical protein
MKINWKVLTAVVVIVGATFWAVESVRSLSYSGTHLNFGVGSGTVTLTNPSNEPVPVQLVGTGTRSFSVSSSIAEVTGSSTREGSGRNTMQLFEFALPPGVSEFTIARGTHVSIVANTETNLEATVQPVSASESRTIIIMAAVVALGALFYISRTTGHRWIGPLRRKADAKLAAKLVADKAAAEHGQGQSFRAYGDNRAKISN